MVHLTLQPTPSATELVRTMSDKDREGSGLPGRWSLILKNPWIDLAYMLLQSLPRFRLAELRDRINPLLEFDILGVRSFMLTKLFQLAKLTVASTRRNCASRSFMFTVAITIVLLCSQPTVACSR